MEAFVFAFVVPVAAVLLDSLFGDPKNIPHPVRYIGQFLDMYEASARKVGINLRAAGGIAVVILSVTVWSVAEFFMAIPYIGVLVALYLAYAGLALGCLFRDARNVASLLDTGNLDEARDALAMLVSRDTSELDPVGVRRALAETVSENLNDGFVAPLFYLAIFGPGGMWAYKTISTMDSMWGYKTERFQELGRAAAKTDDFLAYIPARLTAWGLLFTGKAHGLDYANAKTYFAEDARKMESPNAGWPMAAAAWLYGGQMGGVTTYFGKTKNKPTLGPAGKVWDKDMIRDLIMHCKSTGHMIAWSLIVGLGWLQIAF